MSDQDKSAPKAVEVAETKLNQEELDLAELEEERKRIRRGLFFGLWGSTLLIGFFYVLHEIFGS